jgi:peroxiredoxin
MDYSKKINTAIRFIADDQSFFVSALGLVLDGTVALGGPRAKVTNTSRAVILSHISLLLLLSAQRFVITATDDTIDTVSVEENAGELVTTEASKVLSSL